MPVRFLPLQLRQLRFHLCYQHLQLLLTLLARVRIHIPRVLFAVDPRRGVRRLLYTVGDEYSLLIAMQNLICGSQRNIIGSLSLCEQNT